LNAYSSPSHTHINNFRFSEAAVSIPTGLVWTTGGGFSNLTDQPLPWYQVRSCVCTSTVCPRPMNLCLQARAVQNYLATGSNFPPAAQFNATGRAYPDVSGGSALCLRILPVCCALLMARCACRCVCVCAAIGHNLMTVWNGFAMPTDGTRYACMCGGMGEGGCGWGSRLPYILFCLLRSAATPIFAAMLSLLNDARATAGKPPIGFVNPLL
jgi:hypothetical protein